MSDIFGRSTSAPTDTITRRQIASMIKRYVTSGLNLVDVDPGEIVVFGDKTGKLKTSNLSLDDLLTKPPNAADDSIVVFKSGKLAPSHNIKTLDKITEIETDLEAQIKDYKQFRRNVIAKFFGAPLVVTPSLAEIKNSIEDTRKKLTDDITAINSRLDVIRDTKSILDLIEINKQEINNFKEWTRFNDKRKPLALITDKIKIPHDDNDVKGISYVVHQQLDIEYLNPDPGIVPLRNTTFVGLYRFTVFSEHQFNIEIAEYTGTNTVLFYVDDIEKDYFAVVTPTNTTIARAKFGCILEYVSAI